MIQSQEIDLLDFLSRWYGPPAAPAGPEPDGPVWLPHELRDWLHLSSRWAQPLISAKRMLPADQISPVDGYAVFMTDATGDWRWAFDIEQPDRIVEAELYESWLPVPESWSEFLKHNALSEATCSGPVVVEAAQVEESLLPEILRPLEQVDFGEWRWPRPGGKVFVGGGMIAQIGPAIAPGRPGENRPGFCEVRVAAKAESSVQYLLEIDSISWMRHDSSHSCRAMTWPASNGRHGRRGAQPTGRGRGPRSS